MQLPASLLQLLVFQLAAYSSTTRASPVPSGSSSADTTIPLVESSVPISPPPPPARTKSAPLASPPSYLLLPSPNAELKARDASPEPQQTCANSGSGNSGCSNSGINNSGTANSGINNCGTNLSGVGEGCSGNNGDANTYTSTSTVVNANAYVAPTGTFVIAAGATGYTTTLTGPTSTVTMVGDRRNRRTDCAYWQSQGYVCSGASVGRRISLGVLGAAVAAGVWWVVL